MHRIPFFRKSETASITKPASGAGPTLLGASDLERVCGGLPRGGGWAVTPVPQAQGGSVDAMVAAPPAQDLPRGGGW
jgi:hypothetical protein